MAYIWDTKDVEEIKNYKQFQDDKGKWQLISRKDKSEVEIFQKTLL